MHVSKGGKHFKKLRLWQLAKTLYNFQNMSPLQHKLKPIILGEIFWSQPWLSCGTNSNAPIPKPLNRLFTVSTSADVVKWNNLFQWTVSLVINCWNSNCTVHMQVINGLTLLRPRIQLNLITDCVMIRRGINVLEFDPLQSVEVKHWQTGLKFNQTAHLEPFLLSNMKHFQKHQASVSASFFKAFRRPPTLFNDSRRCCYGSIISVSFTDKELLIWVGPV